MHKNHQFLNTLARWYRMISVAWAFFEDFRSMEIAVRRNNQDEAHVEKQTIQRNSTNLTISGNLAPKNVQKERFI